MSTTIQPIEPTLRANIVTLADSYMRLTGDTNISALSRRVYNDGTFLAKLKEGKGGFGVRKYDELIAAFRRIWPEDGPFPTLIDPTHIAGEANGPKPKKVRKESRSPRVKAKGSAGKKARHTR